MNWPAIVVALVIASAVALFVRGSAFPIKIFFATFAVFAIVFHLKPSLLGKLNAPDEADSDDDSQQRIDAP